MLLDCSPSMGIVPTFSTSLISNTRTKNVEKQPKMKEYLQLMFLPQTSIDCTRLSKESLAATQLVASSGP